MPALTKWGGTMVGITLLLIGALGIYETFFEGEDDHKEGEEFEKISEPKIPFPFVRHAHTHTHTHPHTHTHTHTHTERRIPTRCQVV
jgi:ABC-type nickel/cobalt efflux system permease component RcnA